MENLTLQAKPQKPKVRLVSIRTQLMFGTVVLLLLVVAVSVISYFSLRRLRTVVQTGLMEANQMNELSLGFQNEYLLARGNEADILANWEVAGSNGLDMGLFRDNQNHISNARRLLRDMEGLVERSSNPEIQSMRQEVHELVPHLDKYEEVFQATITALQERDRSENVKNNLQVILSQLDILVAALPDPRYRQLISGIRSNEQAYIDSGRKEYVETLRLKVEEFVQLVENTDPAKLGALVFQPGELARLAKEYLTTFNELESIHHNVTVNTSVFQEVTTTIDAITDRILEKSNAGLSYSQNQWQRVTQQITMAIFLASVVALVIATVGESRAARWIIRPIKELSKAAEKMGQGNLTEPIHVKAGAELVSLAESFNMMADQLRQSMEGLEWRVSERTSALERRSNQLRVAAEIAREATSLSHPGTFLSRTVNLVRDRFGFYHVSIFLLDAKGEYAVLRAATGEAGQKMLDEGHKQKVGETSNVGYVTQAGEPRVALDVGQDASHWKNPWLPQTQSEMVLPLKIGQQVIGALDVQSNQPTAFDQDDVAVLQLLTNQLAVAIENARLYQESQENLKQLHSLYGRYSREAWDKLNAGADVIGFQYDSTGIRPVYRHQESDILSSDQPGIHSFPLEVRGQEIGTLKICTERDVLTSDEVSMLYTIVDRLSQAMESARLFEAVQARAERERVSSEITRHIRSSTNIDTIMQTAVQELSEALRISKGVIQLCDGDGDGSYG